MRNVWQIPRPKLSLSLIFAAAAGGALGAVARYILVQQTAYFLGTGFPLGTLLVNALGSFILGVAVEVFASVWEAGPVFKVMLVVGLCGSLTTFSAFSMDLVMLTEQGNIFKAGLYLIISLMSGVLALLAGMIIVRAISS